MTIAHMAVFAGQSNARCSGTDANSAGHGPTGFPGGWTSDANIKIWWYAAQAWQTYNPGVNTDWTGGTGWSMEAEYARQWRLDHPSDTLYIWKQAVDGTPLYSFNDPSKPDWSPHTPYKNQWFNLIEQTKAAQAALIALGLTPQIDTMIWFQGETDENDANDQTHNAEYLTNMIEIIERFRVIFQCPNMHVVIVRILPYWTQHGGLVREAQAWIGALPHNAMVDIDSGVETLSGSSGSHIDNVGAVTVGARAYAADKAIP